MIIPHSLDQKFTESEPLVKKVSERVKETLLPFCESQGFAFTSRIKTIQSVAEKVETGRFRSWSSIDDLFACTIIIPTLSYEAGVVEFCRQAFDIRDVRSRGHVKKAPDVFRFESTRLIARLRRPADLDSGMAADIYGIRFEIQVRSAFEHAWAVSTHALAYKSSAVDWKRLRLAAQIKATVEQLDTLILAFEEASLNVSENPWPELSAKRSVAQKVDEWLKQGRLPSECRPKDLSRFADNVYALLKAAHKEDSLNAALEAIEKELTETHPDRIPRSVSLFQYFLATLIRRNVIPARFQGYTCHVSQDLLTLYPELNAVSPVFDYDS